MNAIVDSRTGRACISSVSFVQLITAVSVQSISQSCGLVTNYKKHKSVVVDLPGWTSDSLSYQPPDYNDQQHACACSRRFFVKRFTSTPTVPAFRNSTNNLTEEFATFLARPLNLAAMSDLRSGV